MKFHLSFLKKYFIHFIHFCTQHCIFASYGDKCRKIHDLLTIILNLFPTTPATLVVSIVVKKFIERFFVNRMKN